MALPSSVASEGVAAPLGSFGSTGGVAAFESELCRVVLNVASPTGHTYRVRRPNDSPLKYDGHLPVLGQGCWRARLARYDIRW